MSWAGRLKGRLNRWLPGVVNAALALKYKETRRALLELNYGQLWPQPLKSKTSEWLAHYLRHGWKSLVLDESTWLPIPTPNGRRFYDELLYLQANPDVAEAVRTGTVRCGLDHFLSSGFREIKAGSRRLRSEDAERMETTLDRCQYGLVYQWNGKNRDPLWLSHYMRRGWTVLLEDQLPLTFELNGSLVDYVESQYLRANHDLATQVRNGTLRCGLDHFLAHGYSEILAGQRKLCPETAFPKVIEHLEGGAPRQFKHLCFLSHSDPSGDIDPTVLAQVRALRGMGCDVVFLSGIATHEQAESVRGECAEVLLRTGAGGDYAAWYLALVQNEELLDRYDQLLWVNDQAYFPVRNPDDLIPTMERAQYDFWGITDTYQPFHPHIPIQYRLHRYFLGFSREARANGLLGEFRRRFESKPVRSTAGESVDFELGLCKFARDASLRLGAYCQLFDVLGVSYEWPLEHLGADTSIEEWRILVSHFNCPALNRRLLQGEGDFSWEDAYTIVDPNLVDLKQAYAHAQRIKATTKPSPPRHIAKSSAFAVAKAGALGPDQQSMVTWDQMTSLLSLSEAELSALRLRSRGDGFWERLCAARAKPMQILRAVERGNFSGEGRLCLFAHHDTRYRFADYVFASLRGLERLGFEIILITTLTSDSEIARLPGCVKRVLVKNDMGRDFGSWWLAIDGLEPALRHYDEYLLTNDSFFFPIVDPSTSYAQMAAKHLDFWGMNDSDLETWHVTSYFWVFKRDMFFNAFAPRFLKEMVPFYQRWDTVRCFEMRYAGLFRSEGYRVGAFLDCGEVCQFVKDNYPDDPRVAQCDRPINPYHLFWDVIIKDFRAPFLKIDLLRDNPSHLESIKEVKQFIDESTHYDYQLIVDHLGDLSNPNWSQFGKRVRHR